MERKGVFVVGKILEGEMVDPRLAVDGAEVGDVDGEGIGETAH